MSHSPTRPPVVDPIAGVAWKVAAGLAALLAAFLGGGFLLPGTWTAQATRTIAAPPERVLEVLTAPRRWDEWTPTGGVSFREEGPSAGVGARRTWDDPDVGSGVFTITDVEFPGLVGYRVEVDRGLVTSGTFQLETRGAAETRVTWREEGDFGRNPLLGWSALVMKRSQGGELERGLERLAAVVESGL